MRIGKGVAMSPGELDRLYKGSGKGTLSDPKIYYNTNTNSVSRVLLEQCEKVAKDEARRLGMTCAVIRGDLHNTTRTLDEYTKEVIMVEDPTNKGKLIPLLEPIDDHLTIAFGSVLYDRTTCGTDNIQIQGHLFLNVEREPGSTSWTNQRHESGLILPKPLWDMSKEFDAGLAKITVHAGVVNQPTNLPSLRIVTHTPFDNIPLETVLTNQNPQIFWGLSPNDIPRPVKDAVETAVRQQIVEHGLTCAIIRLETLAGYYDGAKNKNTATAGAPDEPVGHFAIYLGTTPADAELKTHLPAGSGKPGPPHASASPAAEQDDDGARTPSMSEIEEEYSQVEKKSKGASKRLSKIGASVGKFVRLN
ncbi:hypothetical protein KVR01_011959 [Diaporthe batatas]|uniref:uncharacterized protein n=1 Tax=Diaporthe batatas TaxID=748121 RepID=UPI001D0536A4|nr:uncharacterized protein KVR01_011959 [Diaporthe batatas]KAG8158198.1 hypothetical protein KVR01_011959 [Diaporthe batatas]